MQKLLQERIVTTIGAVAGSQRALDLTVEYVKDVKLLAKPLVNFKIRVLSLRK
jgi:alkylation response protein AidB-like acyl-CoA dehydrogenase